MAFLLKKYSDCVKMNLLLQQIKRVVKNEQLKKILTEKVEHCSLEYLSGNISCNIKKDFYKFAENIDQTTFFQIIIICNGIEVVLNEKENDGYQAKVTKIKYKNRTTGGYYIRTNENKIWTFDSEELLSCGEECYKKYEIFNEEGKKTDEFEVKEFDNYNVDKTTKQKMMNCPNPFENFIKTSHEQFTPEGFRLVLEKLEYKCPELFEKNEKVAKISSPMDYSYYGGVPLGVYEEYKKGGLSINKVYEKSYRPVGSSVTLF